jgi:hypothetical protein
MDKSQAGSDLVRGGWIGIITSDEYRLGGGKDFTIELPFSSILSHVARLKSHSSFTVHAPGQDYASQNVS